MKIKNLVAAVSMALSVGAFGATGDGGLGVGGTGTDFSQGTVDINLTVPKLIQLTGLNTITMSDWDGATASSSTGADSFCVYINTSPGATYEVVASSNHPSGTLFRMANVGDTAFIPYTVAYDDDADASAGGVGLTATTTTTSNFVGSTNTDRLCGASDNASVAITIAGTDMNAVAAGAYDDILTLRVTPD